MVVHVCPLHMLYKVPLREVRRGVAQGHIVIATGRDNHLLVHATKLARENNDLTMLHARPLYMSCVLAVCIAVYAFLCGRHARTVCLRYACPVI